MLYGLFIGVENYTNGLKPVPFAEKDATEVHSAFVGLGAQPESLKLLLQNATYGTVETWVKKVCGAAGPDDTIIIFFAGHGLLDNGQTFLSCVDTHPDNVRGSAIAVEDIMFYLKASSSIRNIMFLDACHSGVDLPENLRSVVGHFSEEELQQFFEDAEFRVGFASCRSDQKSYSSRSLQNGIWSHYLIKALRGEAPEILEGGFLIGPSLQNYLSEAVRKKVVEENGAFAVQSPRIFGTFSRDFPIADLSSILEERAAVRRIEKIDARDLHLRGSHEGRIEKLKGWKKGNVAPRDTQSGELFFADLCRKDLNRWKEETFQRLKECLGYKLDDIRTSVDSPHASIQTPDFALELSYEQLGSGSYDYECTIELHSISDAAVLENQELNDDLCEFDSVALSLASRVDLKEVIRALENELVLKFKYPSHLKCVHIFSPDGATKVTFKSDEVSFEFSKSMGPADILKAFQESSAMLVASSPTLRKLLERSGESAKPTVPDAN